MVSKKRTDQGGSVGSFILVGVIVAALLFGIIYYLRERGEAIRKEQEMVQYEKDQADEKAQKAKDDAKTTVSTNTAEGVTYVGTVTSKDLPKTGPNNPIIETVGIFMFVTFLTAYFGSKRELSRYL